MRCSVLDSFGEENEQDIGKYAQYNMHFYQTHKINKIRPRQETRLARVQDRHVWPSIGFPIGTMSHLWWKHLGSTLLHELLNVKK